MGKIQEKGGLIFVWGLILALGSACSRPSSEEMYVHDYQKDAFGQYVFELDFSQPLSSYDLRVGVNMECDDREFASFENLPLHFLWQSPTDSLYEEDACLNRDAFIGGDFYSKQLAASYREGFVPRERGKWKIKISVPDSCVAGSQLLGIGLQLEKH